jgi:Anti-sigma-K factor rskA
MNGRPTNEEREALIVGDRAGLLDADAAADLALLADLLGDPSTWVEPNAGLEADVVGAVMHATPSEGAAPSSSARVARRSSTRRRRRRRFVVPAVSAAAALSIVIGTVAVAGSNASVDFTAKLSATAAAPAARASADFTRNQAGFRVALDARGLPPLPAGEYYQAWLKNSAGTAVPIGTFSSSDGRVTLWSGVSPKVFHVISVTVEAADGNQAPGRRVLLGEIHAH